jgi:hypothetical protein
MKLKFVIKHANIEYFYKVLSLVNNLYWDKGLDDKIYFYFDDESIVIYPSEKAGIDRVYARIKIEVKSQDANSFFNDYLIKSLKEKNAMLVQPKKLSSLIENLKRLHESQYDAAFKLT